MPDEPLTEEMLQEWKNTFLASGAEADRKDRLIAEVRRLAARVEALEGALKPFAEFARSAWLTHRDGEVGITDLGHQGFSGGPTLDHCRRAAALREARLGGAERMREKAAKLADAKTTVELNADDGPAALARALPWRNFAKAIRALPLED